MSNELSENAREARKLGLSYGIYMGYRQTLYLEKYKNYLDYIDLTREKVSHLYISDFGGVEEVNLKKGQKSE